MAVNIVTGMVGDDHITSHDDRARHAAHFGRGKYVFPVGERFSAEKISENLVRIKDGMCINQGTQMGIEPNDYTDVEIDNGITGVNRHDLICMRYTKNADTGIENASLVVVKGTSGSEPTDPDVIEGNILDGGDLEDDMPLFRVVIEGITITSIVPVFDVFDGGNDKIEEIEQEIDSLSDDVTDLNNAMGGISRDVSALQGNVSTLQGNVSSLQSTLTNHTTSIAGLEGDIDSLGGRMNTAESDINTLETNQTQILSDVEDLEHSLSTTKTATGNPISISDSAHVNAEELTVELEPIQDLHGYDKPWVGGAGKNLLPLTVDGIKAPNTSGTWSGNSYTVNGVTFSIITDNGGNVTGIKANGTASDTVILIIGTYNVPAGTYKYNGCPSGGSSETYYQDWRTESNVQITDIGNGSTYTFTTASGGKYARIIIVSGVTMSNLTFVPMIRVSTETADFEPYSNICPISGYDETSVVRSGKNLLDYTKAQNNSVYKDAGTNRVLINASTTRLLAGVEVESGVIYTISFPTSFKIAALFYYDNPQVPSGADVDLGDATSAEYTQIENTTGTYTFTATQSKYIYFYFVPQPDASVSVSPSDLEGVQLELGSTATSYEPYAADTYTLQFGDTVYGAEVDFVNGVATVKYGYADLGDLEWKVTSISGQFFAVVTTLYKAVPTSQRPNFICSEYSIGFPTYTDALPLNNGEVSSFADTANNNVIFARNTDYSNATDFKTAMQGVQLVYELATPFIIQLTPQQIKMLKGNNVLVADGDMDLVYQVDSVVGDVKEWAEEKFIPYNSYNTPPVFGFHIDGSDSDPESRVTYIADNANYTPAHMDYTADKFRYNSWQDAWFIKYCKPCILNQDGTVKAYLNPNDYTKDVDGNTVVIDENLSNANVMIEFPKIWYKVVPDASDVTSASVYFSPVKVDDGYKDYAYIDKDGVHKEHFYMPAYNGSVLSGTTVMRSLSGQAVSKNLDASTEIAYAKANGDGWNTEDAGEVMLINFLLILMGKSTDTQTVFGRGIDSGGETAFNNYVTGAGNMKGLFYGTNTGTGLVKVFGIENWWGLQWRRYAGDVLDNGVRKVKLCYGNEDGSTTFDFNIDGTGYVDVGVTPSGTSSGYIRTMKFVHDGMYSAISDGSSSTYYCDGQWFNNAYHTIYALHGGAAWDSVRCGAFCVRLATAPGDRYWVYGADVSYK